mmetsp:Transcript_69912/g.127486  ORF Transcript_69912/g.127486 Transcript_69912/m.127486 type:complete len:201 (+) Transcript_69912:816-1418(+)
MITRTFSPAARIMFTRRWIKMSHTSRSFLDRKSPYRDELPSHVGIRITAISISATSFFSSPLNNFRATEKFASLNESGALPGSAMPTFRTPSISRKISVSTGSNCFESTRSTSSSVPSREIFKLSEARPSRKAIALPRCCRLMPVPMCTSRPEGSEELVYVCMIRALATVLGGARACRYNSAACSESTAVPSMSKPATGR